MHEGTRRRRKTLGGRRDSFPVPAITSAAETPQEDDQGSRELNLDRTTRPPRCAPHINVSGQKLRNFKSTFFEKHDPDMHRTVPTPSALPRPDPRRSFSLKKPLRLEPRGQRPRATQGSPARGAQGRPTEGAAPHQAQARGQREQPGRRRAQAPACPQAHPPGTPGHTVLPEARLERLPAAARAPLLSHDGSSRRHRGPQGSSSADGAVFTLGTSEAPFCWGLFSPF